MTEEMAVTDITEEPKVNGDGAAAASSTDAEEASSEPPSQVTDDAPAESTSETSEATTSKEIDTVKARKRRASSAFSDDGDNEFRGFDQDNLDDSTVEYNRVLERIEAEVSTASDSFTRVRRVSATPSSISRVSKRLRHDTTGTDSRPSSALSSRSDGDGMASSDVASSAASSPAHRRRPTTEMRSPALRVPLERGWRRELVHRAALDAHSRRNADIYYYMPSGKKLRSTREVAENLAGTGLTLENFSFFKEPLGIDDPEKEIIRDARMMGRRVDSPTTAPPAPEGKRTPKPKAPKGASPEPATPKSPPPAKIKVKSVGSRLSGSAPAAKKETPKKTTDNNNTTAWKKPSVASPPPAAADAAPPTMQSPPQQQQPCSIACGGGAVPSLACGACLCLFHPPCVGHDAARPMPFLCKNCGGPTPQPRPAARRPPAPPKPKHPVMLTMKVASSEGGQRVWSVSAGGAGRARAAAAAQAAAAPQSLVTLRGRRFVVVPRACEPAAQTERLKPRLSNGAAAAAPAAPATPPARRGRRARDDIDYFTDFWHKSKQHNYHVALQTPAGTMFGVVPERNVRQKIFQYVGMRDLARCARVSRLWREAAGAPALWRHVRMKNSHVSDWAGLCAALKRHGTQRLDLRKMLLPQDDAAFWEAFAEHIHRVDTLERLEMCRCPARAVEAVCRALPNLRALGAVSVRDNRLDPAPLARLPLLTELRLKSMAGLTLTAGLDTLSALTNLTHLSLTSIKELGLHSCESLGALGGLRTLELGECSLGAAFGPALARLTQLRRLRLERSTTACAAPALLRALAALPCLEQLELVNFDVKVGFDDALAECRNIQRLLIIPTYVSQSATTNKQVLSGVLRLKDTLTHLMWGVTIELLRVTELFIDQCDQTGDNSKKDIGECIPVLKPVPGCRLPDEHAPVAGPPQVEILPLPTLQRLLAAQLPRTKLKLLRIPFHATWRQTLSDFQ